MQALELDTLMKEFQQQLGGFLEPLLAPLVSVVDGDSAEAVCLSFFVSL